jgi:hypothetical protein
MLRAVASVTILAMVDHPADVGFAQKRLMALRATPENENFRRPDWGQDI